MISRSLLPCWSHSVVYLSARPPSVYIPLPRIRGVIPVLLCLVIRALPTANGGYGGLIHHKEPLLRAGGAGEAQMPWLEKVPAKETSHTHLLPLLISPCSVLVVHRAERVFPLSHSPWFILLSPTLHCHLVFRISYLKSTRYRYGSLIWKT